MTNPSRFEDLIDGQNDEQLSRAAEALAALHQRTSRNRLPAKVDQAIAAAIAAPALKAAPDGPKLRSRVRIPRWAWSGALAAVVVVGGILGYGLMPRSEAAVSAADVLQRAAAFTVHRGQVATFLYREQVTYGPGRHGDHILCDNHSGKTTTTYSRLWLRGATPGAPQSVVQNAGLGCFPCPSVVVGRTMYRYLYSCGSADGPSPYGPYMQPIASPDPDLAENLLYGVSTAKMLQRSMGGTGHIRAYKTRLKGRTVYAVEVKNWPGEQFGGTVTFYFDSGSYLLRGIDYRRAHPQFPIPKTDLIRLVHQRLHAPAPAWEKALALLPAYAPPRPLSHHFGAYLIGMSNYISRSRLHAACPRVHGLNNLLRSGSGPLGACRTAYPHMTANGLARLMLKPDVARLWEAHKVGIFPSTQVRRSIRYAQARVTHWVTYKKSLRYG